MSTRPDLENLRRVIMAGATDAAKDAGLAHFAITVEIRPALALTACGPVETPLIEVEILEISEEEAQELARRLPS